MKQRLYLALKAANLALATLWSFALVYVLIRTLGLADYSVAVLVGALGSYVMATDLGFSAVLYHRVRQAFLAGSAAHTRPLVVTSLALYAALAAAATAAFAAFVVARGSPQPALGFVLYFAAFVLALPWTVVRSAAAATDRYLVYEAVELARRVCALALVLAMQHGLGFAAYAAWSLLAWALAFGAMLPVLARVLGGAPLTRADWNPRAVLHHNRGQVGAAGVFSLAEFAIYNFPYLALPLVFGRPLDVIAFDVFFKVTRFGAQAYLVANEGLLPAGTRALHRGDHRALARTVATAIGLSALPCLIGAVAVTAGGERVFAMLLGDAALMPASVRWAMAAVLAAMLFQAAAGTLLLNTGKAALLARIAVAMALAMAGMTAAAALLGAGFGAFMSAYVAVFACGALVYFVLLLRRVAALRAGGSW